MSASSAQPFHLLCRTCMHEIAEASSHDTKTELEQKWRSIFDSINECGAMCIAELLNSTIPQIEVQSSDALPKKMCCDCLEQLQALYRFQQMCVQSDKQMREFIAEGSTELETSTTKVSSVKEEISANKVLKQEISSAGNQQTIEFAAVHISPPTPQTNAADPLQNNEVVMEDCTDKPDDAAKFVKNEPCDEDIDEANIDEYNDDETPLSMYTVKNKVVKVEWKAEQVKLRSSQYKCHLCNESFEKPRYLKKHLKQHKKENKRKAKSMEPKKIESYRFQCDICNRHFQKPESLHKHRLTHDSNADTELTNNVCDICEKKCCSKRALKSHKKTYHSTIISEKPMKLYPCEFCDKSYNRCDSLRVHLRTHTGERPFLCPECGKAFSQAGNLKMHRLRHVGEKSFECPHCPAKFTCPNDVSKHKSIHDKIKRHICDVCGSSFSKSDDLKRHKMLHSGVKPYKCDYCEMRFIRFEYQRNHMRTHTGEKPFKCQYCERAFAQSNDHRKHLRTHLGKNVYRCELCPLAFRLAKEMRCHFATHKNEDPETRERNIKALKEEEERLLLKYKAKPAE